MKVTVWGCRGSIPSPGPEKNRYGGNTSCVQVVHGDTCIILDSGSGIQRLGQILNNKYKELHILLSHLHIDHTRDHLTLKLSLLNPARKKEGTGSLRVNFAARYIEGGIERRGGGPYWIAYRWTEGGLFGGHSFRLTGMTRG